MATTKEKVSNNIPDDLAFDILSKLSMKSLKRFSCVRKSWADLFENPQLMNIYCNNFISEDDNDNACLLLTESIPNTHRYSMFLLSGERFKLDWPPPFQEDDINIEIWGPVVNGIVCLYKGRDCARAPEIALKVVLWNPSTKEFKVIPPSSVDCPLGVDIIVDLNGFGYDPVTDDYKLIQHFYFYVNSYWHDVVEDYSCAPKPSWQIYSLKRNSRRKLDVEMPKQCCSNVYLNGACHWLGHFKQSGQDKWGLVSFNLSDEVFHTTPKDAPPAIGFLMALNNSVGMVTMYAGDTCCDIFILGEIGVKESWTKLFTIGPLPCVAHPIELGKKGDLFYLHQHPIELGKNGDLIYPQDDGVVAWFDLSRQMIEEINGVKFKREYSYCQIVTYKESILPIGGINN